MKTQSVAEHSLAKSITLHLLPGLAAVGVFALLSILFSRHNIPPVLILNVTLVLTVIPIELGIIIRRSILIDGSWFSRTVIPYVQRLKWYEYLLYVAIALVWPAAVFSTIGPAITQFTQDSLFSWLPSWFDIGAYLRTPSLYARNVRIVTWVLTIFLGSLVGPAVEELYFRGYLLSRLSRYRILAPIIGTVLFALYHFWSPQLILTRVIAVFPLTYLVWKKRNIIIGIAAHCLLNFIGDAITAIPAVFGS